MVSSIKMDIMGAITKCKVISLKSIETLESMTLAPHGAREVKNENTLEDYSTIAL